MDLPVIARRPFTEVDGTVGERRARLSGREGDFGLVRARPPAYASGVLQKILSRTARCIESSGSAVVFGAMIRSILHDGPIATVASLMAVLVIIAFIIRRRGRR